MVDLGDGTRRRTPDRYSLRGAIRILSSALLALSLAVTAGADPDTPPAYTITDLGTLGGTDSYATAINNRGQIVGHATVPGGFHAVLWDSTGIHDLGDLGWPASNATAINNLGQVIGSSNTTGNRAHHGFLWDSTGMHDLGALAGSDVAPRDINDAGQIVGSATVNDEGDLSRYHPFLFSNGILRDLGLPPDLGFPNDGTTYSTALAINAAGQVLVEYRRHGPPPRSRYYFWQDGVWQHLSALENRLVSGFGGGGEIIGSMGLWAAGMLPGNAFVYDSTGLHDLGTLGGRATIALAMNSVRQVVGYSQVEGPPPLHPILFSNGVMDRPYLYTGGVMHDLTNLLLTSASWERFVPNGINDHGQIVGTGYTGVGSQSYRTRAYLLSPDPTTRVTLPAAPSGLSVQFASTSKLDLVWIDTSPNEQSFVLERRQITGDWAKIGTVLPNTTTFADTTVAPYTRYLYRVRAGNGAGSSAWSNEAAGDAGIGAVARLGGSALDFGSVSLDSSSNLVSLTLSNRGTGPLDLQSVTLGGSHPGDFTVVESPTRVAPGDTAALRLRFTPTALGSRSAQMILRSNATNLVEAVGLTGSGAPPPVPTIALTPSSLGFGPEPVGLSGTLAVLLHNAGQVPLNLGSIAILGPHAEEFTLPIGSCSNSTLAPGAICLLNVRFSPTATGSRSATLVIASDAGSSPHFVPLTGTGTAPLLRLSAESLRFIIPSAGEASAAQTLTFTNHGDAPLAIEGLALGGLQAGSFHIVSDSGEKSLDPGASRTVKVAFRPAAQIAGTRLQARIAAARIASTGYAAVLEIRHNDLRPGSPRQVPLTAVATAPAAPTPLRAVGSTAAPNRVELSWTDRSPNETEFVLLRRTGTGLYARVAVLPPNTTSFTDTTASPNTSYHYIMRAVNSLGPSAWSNEAGVTTPVLLPPAAPTPLRAVAVTATRVELSWTDRNSSETEFVLLRKTGNGLYARIAVLGPDRTGYTDTTVRPNTSYSYIMRVVNGAGVSPWTNELSVPTPSGLPVAPTPLRAVAVSANRVELTWQVSPSATQFVLLRKVGAGLYQRIAVLPAHTTAYTDNSVSPGTTYTYIMRAVNEFGASAWSNEPTVTTP